jgi:hypothetical protein
VSEWLQRDRKTESKKVAKKERKFYFFWLKRIEKGASDKYKKLFFWRSLLSVKRCERYWFIFNANMIKQRKETFSPICLQPCNYFQNHSIGSVFEKFVTLRTAKV